MAEDGYASKSRSSRTDLVRVGVVMQASEKAAQEPESALKVSPFQQSRPSTGWAQRRSQRALAYHRRFGLLLRSHPDKFVEIKGIGRLPHAIPEFVG